MENQDYLDNEILVKEFIDDYNLEECEKVARLLMKKFNRLKNTCVEEPSLRITSRYEPIYSCPTPISNNQMNKIDKYMDDVKDYQFMNNKIKNVMEKMNSDEKVCFTEFLFHGKTEYAVAKAMGRSRYGIIPFVNSSIIRLVLAFHYGIKKGETFDLDENKEIDLQYY